MGEDLRRTMPYKNKSDKAKHQILYRKTNSFKQKVGNYIKRGLERRKETRKFINNIKSKKGCKYCSENDFKCLDFDHRDPSKKEYNISWMCANGYSREKILLEITKCNVVCSNCHRKRWYKPNY